MALMLLVPISSALALSFAGYLAYTVMQQDEGSELVKHIATAIREGARAYLKRQYTTVAMVFLVVFIGLMMLAIMGYISFFVPYAFIHGGFSCGLAGFLGMSIATQANSRTTTAAKKGLDTALRVAFSSGAVMGLMVVGLVLFDLSIWFYLLNYFYRGLEIGARIQTITSILVTSAIGTSLMAFFARVGGGIYTKAADVGADFVGKVEIGIPEDDPRNAAVIADNVGDNVGDVAGMGADLHESYASSILSAMSLGAIAFAKYGMSLQGTLVPLTIVAAGVLSSVLGIFSVKVGENAGQKALLSALHRGVYLTSFLVFIASFFIVYFLLGMENIGVFVAMTVGLVAGLIISVTTDYYTSYAYGPTRWVASSTQRGGATMILNGLSVGMMSTGAPIIVVSLAAAAGYLLAGGGSDPQLGLYGVAISAVGMLSTLGMTLATDAYGPVADNAGGIAEMSAQDPVVRERTDALDAIGNTTAAVGKGFCIASGVLTVMALLSAYKGQVELLMAPKTLEMSILDASILAGLFIGGMLPFLFSSLTIGAVGRAAEKIMIEVRRQFEEIPGLREGKAKPDYARCVDICTAAALKEMLLPGLIAIAAPVLVGLLLGVKAIAGLLAGALISGFPMAVMMATSGASWDNAKKYIEAGHYGGKRSIPHRIAVVADTIGDPFKDTAGPSLDGLIKLMSMTALVTTSFILRHALLS